ncbi:MAG: NUDIX hydrolase [Sphingobacteriales bacterium]|nr:MAG: NUDIX hydrolase [Sphingobacteriales bacterium]
MDTIEILNRKTLSKERFELETIEFEKKDEQGETSTQKREVYHRPSAVAVLLVDHNKKQLLLTQQFRLPVYLHNDNGGYLLEACAGVIDEGEQPEETALREVREETGYEARNLKNISSTYTSPASIMEYVHLFIADIDIDNKAEEGGGLKEEGEEIETKSIAFDEAKRMLLNSEIHDIKTVALLSYFFLQQA